MTNLKAWRLRKRATLSEAASLGAGHNPDGDFPDKELVGTIKTIEKALIEVAESAPDELDADVSWVEAISFDFEDESGIDPYKTTVDTKKVARWFKQAGMNHDFAVLEPEVAREDFLDPDHLRFAPELALAVHAWRGLLERDVGPGGVLKAIENWVREHPEVWQGKGSLGNDATGRIAKVANWNKVGGATPTPSVKKP